MAKHTITLEKEEIRIINVIKSVMDIKNIDNAFTFIVKDYEKTKSYSKFIKEKRKGIKKK